jgi:hypothetical protein
MTLVYIKMMKKSGIIKKYSGEIKFKLLQPIGFVNKHPFKNLYYDILNDQLYDGASSKIA